MHGLACSCEQHRRVSDEGRLRGVDVEVVVARWLKPCLEGRMTAEQLLDALRSLDDDLESAPSDMRRRLASLQNEVQDILAGGATDLARVESAAIAFLGSHPARVLDKADKPDWYIQT